MHTSSPIRLSMHTLKYYFFKSLLLNSTTTSKYELVLCIVCRSGGIMHTTTE